MTKRQQVIALLALGWSFRRIERETKVRRETVSRYARPADPNPAKVFPGSEGLAGGEVQGSAGVEGPNAAKVTAGPWANPAKVFPGFSLPPRSAAGRYEETIREKLGQGLTAQRIWQDLVEEFGYGYSYESVKRYVRRLEPERRAVGVMTSLPGEEAQVDFFQGPPTLDGRSGQWRRPWIFRMTLCHSRHGYEEAVWDQKLESFLALHERAFRDLGGVARIVRHDNLKAAVVRTCLYDPDVNPVYEAFAKHWGFTGLPTRPRNPEENGKQERSGGYVKDNALRGRRFDSLEELNGFLRRWNRTIARVRIHGTTRRQVFAHYEETDQKALQPLAAEPFAIFQCGTRTVHPDGHVEVGGAFYPVPLHLMGADVQVRWDAHLIRVFHEEAVVAVHAAVRAGEFAPRGGGPQGPSSSQRAFITKLLAQCTRVGPELAAWAEAAYAEREIRALRLIQGALALLRNHRKEAVLGAAKICLTHRLFRYRDLRRFTEMAERTAPERRLTDIHDDIRPISQYRLEVL
jgi:transposase